MKTLTALAMAGALVAGLAVTNPAPAKADGGLVTGLIIGGIAGHVITRHHDGYYDRRYYARRHHHRSGSWRTRRHVNWCHSQYRSYDAYDNTWVSYSGNVRQCRSPYWR
ncbi:BA14K family protein [Tepidamorphus sp. 3E244]|uniref:BA14K family protein n=1 Tax=Tepidamorphus sp. 3E244 TaxID=3385498 RepID=UPI0038FCAF10